GGGGGVGRGVEGGGGLGGGRGRAVVGDALAVDDEVLGEHAPYDVVLSDMAPRTTGNRLGDQTRSFELYMHALAVAERLLKPGGAFVGKIFMGEDFSQAKS